MVLHITPYGQPIDGKMEMCIHQLLSDNHPPEDGPFELIRSRFDRQVYRIAGILENGSAIFAKVYDHQRRTQQFKAYLSKAGAGHDWRIANGLMDAGFFAPPLLAWAYHGANRLLPRKTVFVQQWFPDGVALSRLLRDKTKNAQLSAPWLQQLSISIGMFMAKIHLAGFWPRDFHPGNLLVNPANGPDPNFILIDYEAIELKRKATSVAHLSLGHMASYLLAHDPDIHIRLADGYCRTNQGLDAKMLASKVLRVASEHHTDRQRRLDNAFNRIAKARSQNP